MAESSPRNETQQPAKWNQRCSEAHLAVIADSISDWRAVSPFLGLMEAEESAILGSNPHSVPVQRIAMLRKWKQKRGTKATYKRLCRAFTIAKRTDLVDKVKQLLEECTSSSSDEEGENSSGYQFNLPRSDPLTSYASYLKQLYKSMSHSHTSQHWSHLPRCEFIQLAMIKDEEMRRGGPEEEMIRLAQQGKIETIVGRKESIDLHNLFPPVRSQPLVVLPPPPPPPPGRVFLIEGAPGGGKSTLALHICHQWALGASWLERFDLVVFAYLRDEAVQNASALADILPARDIEKSQSIASQMQSIDGSKILLIFDGWDEFPSSLRDISLVSTIIRQPHKLSLHQSTVLITSRPVASENLLHIADRRVEILGFTQLQIREYIKEALKGNSNHIQKLVQHLEAHPVLEGYCYIPLHAAILVHVFLMKGALPTTRHELFCSLVLCCIVREQETHEPYQLLPDLSSLDDLPDDLKAKLRDHCILAYNGVSQDKVVFYLKELERNNLPFDLSSLGLLQAVKGLTLTSNCCSYNFLHLSVQELLAAYHISQMTSSQQVTVFKELLDSSRFQPVLQYYSGFTKLINPEIRKFISSYQHSKTEFRELLPLLQCFFEARDLSLCQLVHRTNISLEYISNPSDYLAIGYFIASLLSTSTADMPPVQLSLVQCKSTGEIYLFKLLLNELSSNSFRKQPNASLRKLTFNFYGRSKRDNAIPLAEQLILIADHLKISSAISEFNLKDSDIHSDDEDCLFYIAEVLQTNTTLTKLSLDDVRLQYTEKFGSALTNMLRVNKSLKHLDFSAINLDTGLLDCILEGLSHNTALTHLILLSTTFLSANDHTDWSFTNMLRVNKSLTHLDLSTYDDLVSLRVCCIFKGLWYNTSLVNFNLRNSGITATDPDTATSFTKLLQVNKSLTHIDLSCNESLSLEAWCVFEGLQYSTSLVNLNLRRTGITATDPDTAMSLKKMLKVNKSLTHFDLSQNESFSLEAHCIFKGLEYNTSLVHLNLCHTGITTTDPADTAMSLTKMLKANKSLTHLDLSQNESFSLEAHCIFEGLQNNTSLVHLNLCCTGITTTDPETATSLIEMLQVNKSLKFLNLSWNKSFSLKAHYIFEGLRYNTSLFYLNLRRTGIIAEPEIATCVSLIKMLRENKSLKSLNCSENGLPDSVCDYPKELVLNTSLTLDLSNQHLHESDQRVR